MAAPGPHGLFGDDGALTRNTITENGVTKKGRGVTCKACGESTQKTDHGAWLAHVSALANGDAPRGSSNDRRAPAAGEPPVPERRGCVIVSSCDVGDRQALPLTLPAPSPRRARP